MIGDFRAVHQRALEIHPLGTGRELRRYLNEASGRLVYNLKVRMPCDCHPGRAYYTYALGIELATPSPVAWNVALHSGRI